MKSNYLSEEKGRGGKEFVDPQRIIRDKFQQVRWQEPLVYDIGRPGERGVLLDSAEPEIVDELGEDITNIVPEKMLRKEAPRLPEVGQARVVKHFTRLSEQMSSEDSTICFPLGTCTMKYNPKIHERFVNMPQFTELHPRQDESTVQGVLEIMYKMQEYLKALSGLGAVSLQPACGSQGVFSNARILRAYQEDRGLGLDKKDEIISTVFSHPCNPATPAMSGYKVITLYPDETGYPNIEKFKAAISERTAGMIICCPDDTGIFNPDIAEINRAVHEAGGLTILDSANANGYFGWARAKESGFDMTHWNLHKSFASPHGGAGPGAGPIAVREDLAQYLPVPTVEYDGDKYYLNSDLPKSIGKIRSFYGNIGVVIRSFAWVTSLGKEGMREVTNTAVLNSNYLRTFLEALPGIEVGFDMPQRLHEIRYSLDKIYQDTGFDSDLITQRLNDFGIGGSFTSHHPMIVPNPITPEPTETYSKEEIDEYAAAMKEIVRECYEEPELIEHAPNNCSFPNITEEMANPERQAPCRSVFERVHKGEVK